MKGYVKPIIIAIVAGGGATYAANETVTMNAIDAGGIGKEIGTLELSDTEAGLRVTPRLAGLPPGDHGSIFTLIRIVVQATRQTANQRPPWQLAATTIQRTPASTSGHWARAIRGTCQR
jgi:Cu/Zn superoxide dismutase